MVKITLKIYDDFRLDTIALFDTGADLNCIKEEIIPKGFREATTEKLKAANNSYLKIDSKTDAYVLNNGL